MAWSNIKCCNKKTLDQIWWWLHESIKYDWVMFHAWRHYITAHLVMIWCFWSQISNFARRSFVFVSNWHIINLVCPVHVVNCAIYITNVIFCCFYACVYQHVFIGAWQHCMLLHLSNLWWYHHNSWAQFFSDEWKMMSLWLMCKSAWHISYLMFGWVII